MLSELGYKLVPLRIFWLVFALQFSGAWAKAIDLSSGAKVEFDAIGKPAMINIKGTGGRAHGTLSLKDSKVTGDFAVNLKDLTTDMELRDEHMKEKYLEVGKPGFDKAILKIDQKVDNAELPDRGAWEPLNLKGLLTLHGVTKEVPLTCKVMVADAMAVGTVAFKLRVQDFMIDVPSFAGVTMADEVSVIVQVNHRVAP